MSLNVPDLPGWDDIEACFRTRGTSRDLSNFTSSKPPLNLIKKIGGGLSGSLLPAGLSLYQQLLPIAEEAGDKLLVRTCHVRSMRN